MEAEHFEPGGEEKSGEGTVPSLTSVLQREQSGHLTHQDVASCELRVNISDISQTIGNPPLMIFKSLEGEKPFAA